MSNETLIEDSDSKAVKKWETETSVLDLALLIFFNLFHSPCFESWIPHLQEQINEEFLAACCRHFSLGLLCSGAVTFVHIC